MDFDITQWEDYANKFGAKIIDFIPSLIGAILTLLIGFYIIKLINRLVKKFFDKKDYDVTLEKFIADLINWTLKILLFVLVVTQLGVESASLVAVIGAAGLAIGLALQGSLANFAGGVLILIFKPFKVGDTIEAEGHLGSVSEIQILYTVLNTFDNKRIVIPNGSLSNATLINVSVYDKRRCDMTFGIGYDDDIDKAKKVLQRLFEEDERSLTDPAPRICVGGLGDNSVDLMFRPWVATDDLWPYYWDMQEKVKKAFDEEGISIPYPQRDVHLYKTSDD